MSPLGRPILNQLVALALLGAGYCCWFGGFLGWLPGTRLTLAYRIGLIIIGFVLCLPWSLIMLRFVENSPELTDKFRSILRIRRFVIGTGAALLTVDSILTNSNPFSPLDGMALVGIYIFVLGFTINFYLAVFIKKNSEAISSVTEEGNAYRSWDE